MKIATVQIPDDAYERFLALMETNGWAAVAHEDDLPPLSDEHKAIILRQQAEWEDDKARDGFEALEALRIKYKI